MTFLNNLSIGKKIYIATTLIVLIFLVSTFWLYSGYRDQIYLVAKKKLTTATETAWGIIDHYSKLTAKGLPLEEAQSQAKDAIRSLRFEDGKIYFWINDTQPKMIMHPIKPELDGQDLSNSKDPDGLRLFVEMVKVTAGTGAGFVEYQWPKPGKDQPQPKLSFVKRHPQWNWIIGSGVYIDDLNAKVNKVFYALLGICFFALIFSLALIYALTRSITKPMDNVVYMISEIENGHYQMRLNLNRKDELGALGTAMDTLNTNFETVLLPTLNRLADGDITFNPVPRDDNDGTRMALKRVSDNLNQTMHRIQGAARQISSASDQVSDASQTLSQGATESAASLEEISSSLNEMSGQTKQNASNASQVNVLSSEAKQAAEEGNNRMERMVAAMTEINEAGQNINKIIKVIDEIAFQTNLLALNAAVEAARAGQHGKGFAVVAEEVRNLAARSSKAASETAQLIAGSVEKTRNGTEIASRTAESLAEIYGSVSKVSDLAEEIAAASNEQAEGISQINEGLGQIDKVIQQNTATAEESAAAAEELSSQAAELLDMLQGFKLRSELDLRQRQTPQVTHQPKAPATPRPAIKSQPSNQWGQAETGRQPKPVIALDDTDFGKF